jgi:hypothetical protein
MHSARDSLYAFNFLRVLAETKADIKIVDLVHRLMKCLLATINCCTENEAEFIGIFCSETFAMLKEWKTRVVWEKLCVGNPSFDVVSFETYSGKIYHEINLLVAESLSFFYDV